MAAHGTIGSYVNDGCRCQECRAANAARMRAWKQQRARLAANDPRHGKESSYRNYDCRCAPCTAANTEQMRRKRQRLKAALT